VRIDNIDIGGYKALDSPVTVTSLRSMICIFPTTTSSSLNFHLGSLEHHATSCAPSGVISASASDGDCRCTTHRDSGWRQGVWAKSFIRGSADVIAAQQAPGGGPLARNSAR
jgi:hypothetical protein